MDLNTPLPLEYMALFEGLSPDDPRFIEELRYLHESIRGALRNGSLTAVEAIPLLEKMVTLNNSTLTGVHRLM